MKNSKEIFRNLKQLVTLKEEPEEIQSILYMVVHHVLGLSRADIISEKLVSLTNHQQTELEKIIGRINQHEPIQYIMEEAYFFGRKFKVNPAVLIPRPETELLIEEALKEVSAHTPGSILDIGTGSGCIAITLSKELPEKKVAAIDVSEGALKIAKENAMSLEAYVEFFKLNALTDTLPFQKLELIVSNPPYVTTSEKRSMKSNVVNFEPHLALFVPDQDPLVFYKMIAKKGYPLLSENGKVAVEINERFGKEVAEVFKTGGFRHVRIVKDLQEKDRIVIATT
jgi:release factor glutamine methyltransferase